MLEKSHEKGITPQAQTRPGPAAQETRGVGLSERATATTEYLGLNAADVALLVGIAQYSLIGVGLWQMREAGQRRDKQLDIMAESLREQSAGIRALLERSA